MGQRAAAFAMETVVLAASQGPCAIADIRLHAAIASVGSVQEHGGMLVLGKLRPGTSFDF